MNLRVPDYYPEFRCLASACPHSCCIGWEVVVDGQTAAYYKTAPGPLGERLRENLIGEGGTFCFSLRGSRCPFLDAQNLCEIHRELGEEHTGSTCRSHPRFTEDYGALREISLAASCPAVTALLFGSQEPLAFPVTITEEPSDSPTDEWLPPLLACREQALRILQDRSLPLRRRMIWFLLFSNDAQTLLDADQAEDLPALCEAYTQLPEGLPEGLPESGPGLFPHALELLSGLEPLEPDWPPLLRSAAELPRQSLCPDWAGERILAYYIFRYFLKTVTDGDLLSRAELAIFGLLIAERLSPAVGLSEALRRYCREIEHCPENLAALQEAFCGDPGLSLSHFFRELSEKQELPAAADTGFR